MKNIIPKKINITRLREDIYTQLYSVAKTKTPIIVEKDGEPIVEIIPAKKSKRPIPNYKMLRAIELIKKYNKGKPNSGDSVQIIREMRDNG